MHAKSYVEIARNGLISVFYSLLLVMKNLLLNNPCSLHLQAFSNAV